MTENPNRERPAESASSSALRLLSLALIFLTILALAAVAYFTERGIASSRDWVVHTYQVRSQLNDLQLEVTRAEADETRYLLAGEKAELPQFRQESELALQTIAALGRLTKDNLHEQERLAQLTRILAAGPSLIAGQPLLWLEAMKMEHLIAAPVAGVVAELPVAAGQQVEVGSVLAVVKPEPEEERP